MLKVLSYILYNLDPKVKVIGQKAGICDGVPSISALVLYIISRNNVSRVLTRILKTGFIESIPGKSWSQN